MGLRRYTLYTLYGFVRESCFWFNIRFSEGGGQLDRRRARGVLNPSARESKARTGRFLREKLISDHGLFSTVCFLPTRADKERRTCKIRRAFSGIHRATDGWMLARAPASPAQGLHPHGPRYFNFPVGCVTLRNLGLLLRRLAVGRRQQSGSIEVALDME